MVVWSSASPDSHHPWLRHLRLNLWFPSRPIFARGKSKFTKVGRTQGPQHLGGTAKVHATMWGRSLGALLEIPGESDDASKAVTGRSQQCHHWWGAGDDYTSLHRDHHQSQSRNRRLNTMSLSPFLRGSARRYSKPCVFLSPGCHTLMPWRKKAILGPAQGVRKKPCCSQGRDWIKASEDEEGMRLTPKC